MSPRSIVLLIALLALGVGGGVSLRRATTPADPTSLAIRPEPPRVELGEEKQKYIWDMEHAAFVLETHVGRPFAAKLGTRDTAALGAYFLPDFRGSAPDPDRAITRRAGIVTEHLLVAGAGDLALNTDGFIGRLLAARDALADVDGTGLRVLHVDRREDDRWDVELLLTLRGRDGRNGPAVWEALLVGELRFDDVDAAKEQPLFARLALRRASLRTSPRALMEEISAQVGLTALPLADNWNLEVGATRNLRHQIAVEDFDRDGWLDIAVGTIEGRPLLLRSVGGRRFEDVAAARGLRSVQTRPPQRPLNSFVTWIDYDDDGFPDLVLGERIYHNEGGARFVDVTTASGLRFDRVPMGSAVADFDGDGRLDLYVAYQKGYERRRPGKRPWVADPEGGAPNQLWRNAGEGKFVDVTEASGAGGGRHQTFATTALYYDEDPWPDLYLANDFGENVLLRNRGDGTFEDISRTARTSDYATSMGVAAGDLDDDGRPELYVANMYSKMGRRIIAHVAPEDYPEGIYEQIVGSCAGNRLYRRDDAGAFADFSEIAGVNAVGWAYAPAMSDLDGDGRLDLYATTGFMSFARGKPDG